MDTFFHSVHLDPDLCKGCINCIKRCPTEAIRVHNGKASIIKEFCIDCGECIRVCPHHAKKATYDPLEVLEQYEYTVALPAPSLYGQFNNLDDVDIVLRGLLDIGFDDVYEVSTAAEMVSELTRRLMAEGKLKTPVISSACPTVARLIRVRFPSLIEYLLPVNPPVELAAIEALKIAQEKTKLPREKIGMVFISPCAAKVTWAHAPLGIEHSEIDAVIAVSEVYPKLLQVMRREEEEDAQLSSSGKIGVSWGCTGGESGGLLSDNYLAADGIENVIRVLEDLEDQKFGSGLEFIELNACSGGCVGGVLTVENPYIANAKLKRLRKYMPVACNHLGDTIPEGAFWNTDVEFQPVYNLGSDLEESINLVAKVDELCERLPGLDCGSCGAPTCRALAQDVIRGNAKVEDCIHILRERIHLLSDEFSQLDTRKKENR